jgi:hypothetical protein
MDKMNWDTVKMVFLTRYTREADAKEIWFDLMNEVAGFGQGPRESIQEYVHRAERLSMRSPRTENRNLAVMFIRGLRDDHDRKLMMVAVRSLKDFTIQGAMAAVKTVYQDLGMANFRIRSMESTNQLSLIPSLTMSRPMTSVHRVANAQGIVNTAASAPPLGTALAMTATPAPAVAASAAGPTATSGAAPAATSTTTPPAVPTTGEETANFMGEMRGMLQWLQGFRAQVESEQLGTQRPTVAPPMEPQ